MKLKTATAESSQPQDQKSKSPEGRFVLSICREEGGAELKRVPIADAYLRDLKHEMLREKAWRHGMPAATLEDMSVDFSPVYPAESTDDSCHLRVDVCNPRGEKFAQEYNAKVFSDEASRAVAAMVGEGVLKLEDGYNYKLRFEKSSAATSAAGAMGMSFSASPKHEPVPYLTRPLKPLLAKAEAVDDPNDDEHFPVFYTAGAYQRAERFSRRGAADQPPLETGAALIGARCSCPESGEFFVVIAEALEATDAEEEKVSLSYTGKTWVRLQAILKSMQAQAATRTYQFLGQAHGHNFVPLDGAPPCEMCTSVKVCSRTSVFVSTDDRTWTQAVFAGAPYALCHIFGLNARHDEVHGLYSLHDNRLTQRGFYVIPEFDPTTTS